MFGYPPDYLGDRNLGDQSRFTARLVATQNLNNDTDYGVLGENSILR